MEEVIADPVAHVDAGGPAGGRRPRPLQTPRDGIPPVVADSASLTATVDACAAGSGPVAVDAERASGYRYSHRAYLVQLRRQGAGTALLDPISCPDLRRLGNVLGDAEWVLHAAGQDLPCLAEVGLAPRSLFDTELAGRLLNYPRVGLASLVEEVLGLQLEKGHSAVDWSTRPLPDAWLNYAALDVEVLLELRDALERQLDKAGKLGWAREEFAGLVDLPAREPRTEPWRRTSGIHRVRGRRQLALVRELWLARDELAQSRDVAPGRVLADAAIVAAALARPTTRQALATLSSYRGRGARRDLDRWWFAVERGLALDDEALPELSAPLEGPPPSRAWADRDPPAANRLAGCRAALLEIAGAHELPAENLLTPEFVRRLSWEPPDHVSTTSVGERLRALGAREWQIHLTADALADALSDPPPTGRKESSRD